MRIYSLSFFDFFASVHCGGNFCEPGNAIKMLAFAGFNPSPAPFACFDGILILRKT